LGVIARKLAVAGLAALVLALTGCMSTPDSRTTNQGGSTVIQAVSKVAGDNLGAMNPDDVQVLTDLAIQLSGAPFPAVTDEQAAAVTSFMAANGITDRASIEALIELAKADPTAVVIPPDVQAVLEQLAADPDAYVAAADQFAQQHGLAQ
jgi:hypothetical protein